MGLFGNQCQSCGMPLKKDPKHGGAEQDGTRSKLYCSYCYDKGAFLDPHISVEAMQEKVFQKMRTLRFPKFLARLFTRQIPRLQRWRK